MNKKSLVKLLCANSLLICFVFLLLTTSGCGCEKMTSATKDISFVVNEADAKPGEKDVAVTVSVKNNPGFASARFEIHYDEALTLTGFTYNNSKLNGASTVPFNAKTNQPCLSVTGTNGNITDDFDFATLYFNVSNKASGDCEVTLSCEESDVYDADENNLKSTITAGKIYIIGSESSTGATANEKSDSASNHDSGTNEKHTVVFKDENGKTLSTQTVKDGGAVPVPSAPEKSGYVFKGWSESVDKITSDKTITPVYEPVGSAPTFEIERVQAAPGDKDVEVTVSIKNNPGIASVLLDILYDTDNLKMTGFEYNTDIIKGSSTVPFNEKATPPCLSVVNGSNNFTGDGVLATLHFDVSDKAEGGYPIVISYDKNNVYNIGEENISFETVNGLIEIK